MIHFLPEQAPPTPGAELVFVQVSGDFSFPKDSLTPAELLELLSGKAHQQFCSDLGDSEGGARLSGRIGIHPTGDGEDPAWAHYEMRFRPSSDASPYNTDVDWTGVFTLLEESSPAHTIQFRALYAVSGYDAFTFPLPMPLDSLGLSGFSEMRGARLVQVDPDDPDDELFSVILDGHPGSAWAQVVSSTKARFGMRVFEQSLARAKPILDLVILPDEGEEAEQR